MKIKEVLSSYHALNILANSKINMLAAFKLSKFQLELKGEFERFQITRKNKLKEFGLDGKVDERGIMVFDEKDTPEDRLKFDSNFKLFLKELDRVVDEESAFTPSNELISITELVKSDDTKIDIEPAVLSNLPWVIGE